MVAVEAREVVAAADDDPLSGTKQKIFITKNKAGKSP